MKLFDILGGKVIIHPDALGIPAFKKVWDADKADKEMATKYISYIVLKNKFDSPYVESMYTEDIEPRLKKELFDNEDYQLPKEVLEAEQAYKGFNYTITLDMLEGLMGRLQDAAKYYKESKGELLDLDLIKKLTDGAKNMSGVIKSIEDLKKAVRTEELNNTRVRGGAEVNPYELPDRKL